MRRIQRWRIFATFCQKCARKMRKRLTNFFLKYWGLSGAKTSKSCRSRQELSNEYFLQNLASIQKRTSPIKLDHLTEKSGNVSISNLSTKQSTGADAIRKGASRARPRFCKLTYLISDTSPSVERHLHTEILRDCRNQWSQTERTDADQEPGAQRTAAAGMLMKAR